LQNINSAQNQISIYGQGKITPRCLADSIVKIKKAFPRLSLGWYEIMQEEIVADKWTDQRLMDAIKHLIRTCQYPEPTIANLLNYDKTKKTFDYYEMLETTKDFSPDQRQRYYSKFTFDTKLKRYIEK
jgi:hypothetical protein